MNYIFSYSGYPFSLHATLAAAMFHFFQETNVSSPLLEFGTKTCTAPVSGQIEVLNLGWFTVRGCHEETNITVTLSCNSCTQQNLENCNAFEISHLRMFPQSGKTQASLWNTTVPSAGKDMASGLKMQNLTNCLFRFKIKPALVLFSLKRWGFDSC